MAHFPDTDTNELEKPYLIVFQDSGGDPLHVESERGWVSGDEEVMLLLGQVHMWRDTPQGVRKLSIRTRDLRVLPDSNYAETDMPVVIRTPTTESRGVGMRAYLGERRVELLSRVRTVYERN
jgi:lipopolysaccharide export system protein LptC